MAVYKRKDGKSWRAVCYHFDRKPAAEDRVRDTCNKIKLGHTNSINTKRSTH